MPHGNIVACCTDRDAALMGKNQWFNRRLKEKVLGCTIFHYDLLPSTHQFKKKKLSEDLSNTLTTVVKMFNFMKAHPSCPAVWGWSASYTPLTHRATVVVTWTSACEFYGNAGRKKTLFLQQYNPQLCEQLTDAVWKTPRWHVYKIQWDKQKQGPESNSLISKKLLLLSCANWIIKLGKCQKRSYNFHCWWKSPAAQWVHKDAMSLFAHQHASGINVDMDLYTWGRGTPQLRRQELRWGLTQHYLLISSSLATIKTKAGLQTGCHQHQSWSRSWYICTFGGLLSQAAVFTQKAIYNGAFTSTCSCNVSVGLQRLWISWHPPLLGCRGRQVRYLCQKLRNVPSMHPSVNQVGATQQVVAREIVHEAL